MGVPGYFGRHILPKYAEAIKNNLPNSGEEFIEAIEFDMGGVMHSCAAVVWSYGDYYNATRTKYVTKTLAQKGGQSILIGEFCATVCQRLKTLVEAFIEEVNPKYKRILNLVITMDGVAPFAKILQQRTRRYRAAMPNYENSSKVTVKPSFGKKKKVPPPSGWDTSSITPGTDFMDTFDRYIRDWILQPEIKKLVQNKIIFSSYRTRGEGEHKPFLYREQKLYSSISEESRETTDRGIILSYGLDADIILLNLLHREKNVYIVREKEVKRYEKQQDVGNAFHGSIIDLDILRDGIVSDMTFIDKIKISRLTENVYYSVIRDYVLMTFFLGNDFLPRILCFMDLDVSLNKFMELYSLYVFNTIKDDTNNEITLIKKDKKNITSDNGFLSRDDGGINWKTLLIMMRKMRDLEPEYLIEIYKKQKKEQGQGKNEVEGSNALGKSIKGEYTIDMDDFRNWWYTLALRPKTKVMRQFLKLHNISFSSEADVDKMGNTFFTGLQWVLLYYTKGTLSVNRFWSYSYTQSPTMGDIYDMCKKMVKNRKTIHISPLLDKEGDPVFGPIHQLLAVLPPKSAGLIVKAYQNLILDVQPLSYLAPITFSIDFESARVEHEGLAVLPMVDPFQIIDEVKKATPARLAKRYLLGDDMDTIVLNQGHLDGIQYTEKELGTIRWQARQEIDRLKKVAGIKTYEKKEGSHKKGNKPYDKKESYKGKKAYDKDKKKGNYRKQDKLLDMKVEV